ncbi:MAG TPA: glycosyltransferase [Gemmatimonadales bacterium]|nr:glycosyltransferase [Gemmatimonadales bacterium]
MSGAAPLPVALFNTRFLPYSQTFVYEEIRLHQRYAAEVFCGVRMLPERFPWAPVFVGGPLYRVTRRSARFDARFRERGYALVHAHFGPGAVYALPFARRHRLPLVVTFHGYDVPILASPRRWLPEHLRYALLGPAVLREMTLGLCASGELLELLAAQGVDRDRLRVHRLGIDVDAFRPGERAAAPSQVVMVGRFVEKKGFEYGLRAFAAVAGEVPALRLTLIGEGDREPALRAIVRGHGLEARVTFAGVLPPERVAAILATAHVLLAPSVVEPGSGNRESGLIVVKEASAAGAVPIGTRHGGIPEIIDDGVTGYLVPERDAETLAARLRRVVTDPAHCAALGAAAREKMLREYDNRARVRALEERYDEARARFGPGGRAP